MFKEARLKLTLFYLAIISVISISFSLVTYRILSNEVNRFANFQRFRIEQRLHIQNSLPSLDLDLIKEARERIALGLFVVNGIIIVVSGGLAYFLAGRTLKPIQEMVEDQHRFITDSSHELRTPLTSLKLATEVILRDKDLTGKDARKVLSDNLVEINKLQLLTDGLLHLSQLDSSHQEDSMVKLATKQIIEKAVGEVMPQAQNKNIIIKNDVKNFFILGNETDLINLFVILLDNAIKYSPEKSTISITSKKSKNDIYLSVIDQGIGIPERDIPHIFERFYRSDKSRSGARGFGLGLSIAKRITDLHNGAITVVSQINKGTTFNIKLPSANNS